MVQWSWAKCSHFLPYLIPSLQGQVEQSPCHTEVSLSGLAGDYIRLLNEMKTDVLSRTMLVFSKTFAHFNTKLLLLIKLLVTINVVRKVNKEDTKRSEVLQEIFLPLFAFSVKKIKKERKTQQQKPPNTKSFPSPRKTQQPKPTPAPH